MNENVKNWKNDKEPSRLKNNEFRRSKNAKMS